MIDLRIEAILLYPSREDDQGAGGRWQMSDRKSFIDPNETPEDVATLYSWANLHGAKYRDFSASRAQTREKARQRVQDAIEAERKRAREDSEAQKIAEAQKAVEAADSARTPDFSIPQQQDEPQAAPPAAPPFSQQRIWQSPRPDRATNAVPPVNMVSNSIYSAPQPPAPQPPPAEYAYAPAQNYPPAAPAFYGQPAQQASYVPQPAPAAYAVPQPQQYGQYAPPGYGTAREEQYPNDNHYLQARGPWSQADPREAAPRPAWLASDRADAISAPVAPASEESLLASRERLSSRWFALKGVFAAPSLPLETALPSPAPQRAPVLAVFSLAGGVGKTSLVATLGRALSARGERVLLVDTAAYGLLPFFFGARDQRPGVLRTFTSPGASGDAPIQMITIDPEALGPETAPQESLTQEIVRHGRGTGRVIVDLATASGAITRRVLRMAPTVLVPVIPDMSSVVSVGSIDAFFQHNVSGSGQPVRPFYVLNQFDPSLPLHLDVREILREQLGDRLLPFVMRRTPAVSEALAEGMTVVDYAPNSTVAEDFSNLAGWVKSLAAPASNGYRGVRWSER